MAWTTAYIALGANVGDTKANLRAAVEMLIASGAVRLISASSLYVTKPVGVTRQPDFLNAIIRVETTLAPRDLLALCQSIENAIGRQRTMMWGPRVIDIDILLYSSVYVCDDDLVIPHPRMMERAFVLVPLAEIAPELELQGALTARQAAETLGDQGVRRLETESWIGQ